MFTTEYACMSRIDVNGSARVGNARMQAAGPSYAANQLIKSSLCPPQCTFSRCASEAVSKYSLLDRDMFPHLLHVLLFMMDCVKCKSYCAWYTRPCIIHPPTAIHAHAIKLRQQFWILLDTKDLAVTTRSLFKWYVGTRITCLHFLQGSSLGSTMLSSTKRLRVYWVAWSH